MKKRTKAGWAEKNFVSQSVHSEIAVYGWLLLDTYSLTLCEDFKDTTGNCFLPLHTAGHVKGGKAQSTCPLAPLTQMS